MGARRKGAIPVSRTLLGLEGARFGQMETSA